MTRKTLGSRLKDLLRMGPQDEEFFDELEDVLIEGDLGPILATETVDQLRASARKDQLRSRPELTAALKDILSRHLLTREVRIERGRLNLFLVLGVNGVGKTTTIAKLADWFRRTSGTDRIVLGAGDTFRAAAVDQLRLHGERLGLRVVSQVQGSDPGAVLFDCIESARSRGDEIVLADTAGRMHNKTHLVRELEKIDKIVRGKIGDGIYHKLLIIDATTGQNGLRQAEIFREATGIDSAVLTKYDSSAKGGVALSICKQLGIPFSFIGTGEKMGDIAPFDADRYLDGMLEAE